MGDAKNMGVTFITWSVMLAAKMVTLVTRSCMLKNDGEDPTQAQSE